jgi:hypothetical protein
MHRATLLWAQSISSFQIRLDSARILKWSLELDPHFQGREFKDVSLDLLSKSVQIIKPVQSWSI